MFNCRRRRSKLFAHTLIMIVVDGSLAPVVICPPVSYNTSAGDVPPGA